MCEILLPSAAAKGTIRGGQFSQIGNVLQTGGEAGIWNMERYQRWVAQQRDRVQPATERLPAESASASASRIRRPPAAPRSAGGESLEVIDSEEVDLAALARHIGRRNR